MKLYAQYVKEREGNEIIAESWGFLEYHIALPFLAIDSIFVAPEMRNRGYARMLADRAEDIAREAGASYLWSQVLVKALNATDSLKAILAYGFKVQGAENGCIILTKELEPRRG
jgi:GNAT superfamily N-acetyltransferase